jgi:hypothetical protein
VTSEQTLFVVLVALYLSDCFIWTGRRNVLFSSWWFLRTGVIYADEKPGGLGGKLAMLNPLPPLGAYWMAGMPPFSLSPDGVCSFTLGTFPGGNGNFHSAAVSGYEDIHTTGTENKYLLLNDSRFAKCNTSEEARLLEALIRRVSGAPKDMREQLIKKHILSQFSKKEALKRLIMVRAHTVGLRFVCCGFLALLFAVIPLLTLLYGLGPLLYPIIAAILVNLIIISTMYYRAHKRLFPGCLYDRFINIAKICLCPPAAIRAADLLTLNAMTQFHPVTIAGMFSGPDSVAFIRSVINDLKYPVRHNQTDPVELGIASWYAACELEMCMAVLKTQGPKKVDTMLAPPSTDGVSVVYCPRCLSRFSAISETGECTDCPGVALLPIPKDRKQEVEFGQY